LDVVTSFINIFIDQGFEAGEPGRIVDQNVDRFDLRTAQEVDGARFVGE
jgi:hypothetical protein